MNFATISAPLSESVCDAPGLHASVGLVIFAIVIFYSVHFPPVCFAGLLCLLWAQRGGRRGGW